MPFGDVLSELEEIHLKTADEKSFEIKNNWISKIGFKIIGIPHVEMRIRARKIFSFLPFNGNKKKILDAGCGPGIYSLTLLKKNFDVFAIDIDKEKLDFLKKNSNLIHLTLGDITKLPFKSNFFDFIVCSDVLEHIKEDGKALSELTRVLKIGGTMVITVPAYSKKNMKDYKRFKHERVGYSIEQIEKLAKKNSLKIDKIKKYSGPIVERTFNLNEKLYKNKILLGAIFYPLYILSFLEDFLRINKNHFNGLAIKLIKV
jgi:SAM-dependent methyltransferase